jgi:CubicO group peptidase (beta-lactamase class C family)
MQPQARAPLESWQVGPWNRWAYQHVAEVVPTAVVAAAPGPPLPLPDRAADLDGLRFDRADGTPTTLDSYLDTAYVDGLAVLHDGALVLERYRNGMGPGTRHISQSVAKSVLGLLVGVLAGRGLLDPAAPVTDHVPEVAGSGYAKATVRHLLDMTAAIDFVEDYAVDFWKYDVACGWHPPRPGADAGSILEYLPTIGPAPRAHGETLHYASPNTDLLGIVAERAAGGVPLAELIGRELWSPLGAERDADLAIDPAGTAVISGGFCATLRDYARLGRLVLAGGEHGGRQVVPRAWIAELGGSTYRNQWWRIDGRAVARGIHGQMVAVDARAGVVVAILSSWPEATDAAQEAGQHALVAALCGHAGR